MAVSTSIETEHVRVAIVGSGFGGLGMAIRLKEQGDEDFVVFERAHEVGGTWRANTYPGAACDVPSRLYSFSFARNGDWTRSFSPQQEILDYLRDCADRFGVRPHIRFGTTVEQAAWDDEEQLWRIETSAGSLTADVVVSAAGGLSEPKLPPIPGVESFEGKLMHSAEWDHDHDLTGRRVAVIGTGASAIQIVPAIQPHVAQVDVYQRTAPWVMPRNDREFGRLERSLYKRFPALQRLTREAIYWAREGLVVGLRRPKLMRAVVQQLALRYIREQVKDPGLREKVTPDYTIGCKRILISDDYYQALTQENADVITSPIAEVRARSIVTADGAEHPCDTIVFATGFEVTPPPVAERIRGREGKALAEVWRETGMQAYKGTTVAGFPNLFFLVGPNTGLGHNSIVYVIEAQLEYVLGALKAMRSRGIAALEPRAEAQEAYNRDIQAKLEGTVWNAGGCASWYLDDAGRNTTLWPTYTFPMKRMLERFDVAAYETTAAERESNPIAVAA
jgi:cation diffusion facilitator CzcD-associated flavoprotein CzcO